MICSNERRTDILLELLISDCGDNELELYNNISTDEITFTKNHQRKAKQIINNGKVVPLSAMFKRVIQRIAVVFFVVVSLGAATVMSVSSIREAILDFIVEWHEDRILINPTTSPIEPPTEIEEVKRPTDLPEGAEEEILINTKSGFVAEYYVGDEHIATYEQLTINAYMIFDIEDARVSSEVYNDIELTIIEHVSGDVVIYFTDLDYFYMLSGYDVELLKQLASSIK